MCGIAGIVAFNEKGKTAFSKIGNAVKCLDKRGPDSNGTFIDGNVVLAHTRLSIIDTSSAASQPMTDISARYTIIFNGEFFNFKEHKPFLEQNGIHLKSESDTEVLLYLYILEKEECLKRVNGFFSFAIYDNEEETLFIARDRFGVKPLLVYSDDDSFMFASEMKALMAMGIPKELDVVSLFTYLQLNYIPGPETVFKGVRKVEPGSYLKVDVKGRQSAVDSRQIAVSSSQFAAGSWQSRVQRKKYYEIPLSVSKSSLSYDEQQKELFRLLDNSVQRRLISDVPLGAFLSGGIDSSVIVALASHHTQHLHTFSIGFRDEPMFDETRYANLVAEKCKTNHTIFSLTNDDLFDNLYKVLDYIDEPFADSSSLAVYILSMHTRKHVTVALSGDGADELFGGYNKHAAEWKIRKKDAAAKAVRLLGPLWKILPQSRDSKVGNKFRQLNKFSDGMNMSAKERYWRWAGFEGESEVENLLLKKVTAQTQSLAEYLRRKENILKYIKEDGDMNDVLYSDMHLPLPYAMLPKVDLMSMANSLEVRTPFLDYEVVNFAFSLPVSSKIDDDGRKKIVRDAFRKLLPEELYTRRKQGFDVPLLNWFNHELKSLIADDLLSEKIIREQNIFDPEAIRLLKKKLFSGSPGEAVEQVWALLVFQYWWKRNLKI